MRPAARSRASALLVIGLSIMALGGPLSQTAATEQANLPDIEDEVMCTICGTLLAESQSPQADRERVLIRRLIAEGRDKQQIKDALVQQYGEEVLATPGTSGFDLFAWLVPGVGLLAFAVGVGFAVVRMTRRSNSSTEQRETPELDPADARRLDAELAREDP
jgi:cytochrome c-type biogenesis protein CcmH